MGRKASTQQAQIAQTPHIPKTSLSSGLALVASEEITSEPWNILLDQRVFLCLRPWAMLYQFTSGVSSRKVFLTKWFRVNICFCSILATIPQYFCILFVTSIKNNDNSTATKKTQKTEPPSVNYLLFSELNSINFNQLVSKFFKKEWYGIPHSFLTGNNKVHTF